MLPDIPYINIRIYGSLKVKTVWSFWEPWYNNCPKYATPQIWLQICNVYFWHKFSPNSDLQDAWLKALFVLQHILQNAQKLRSQKDGCCSIATITEQCTDISCLWRQNHETVLGTQNLSSEDGTHVWHWTGEGPTVRPSHSEKDGFWVNQQYKSALLIVGGTDEGLHVVL